jgi:alkylation response protein AidB-like acyl-CoA dehydrogenase
MVNLPRCITQGAPQVLRFQIGVIGQDLLAALPSGKERKDVLHTDPHTADAGPAATLIWVVGDALAPTDQDRFDRQHLMALDIVGPDGLALAEAHEPLLSAIAAAAADTDRHGVQRRCFDAMAAAGLLGRPLQPPALQRELAERLFMADGSLTFCWLQHQLPLRRLLNALSTPEAPAASALRERWLEHVASGQALAGVAFAHLRRPGAANPAATRIPGGWRLDGRLDWLTSWDIADLVLLCLRCVDASGDRVVGLLLPGGTCGEPLPAGISLGEPLALLAMAGTHTRPMQLDGAELADSQVLFVEDFSVWSEADAATVCRVSPVVFGCIRSAIADLHQVSSSHHDTQALALADALSRHCQQLRHQAYRLIDANAENSPELRQRHRDLRAQALELAMRSAQAAVIAHAGGAMYSGCAAERRLREASFLLVQAQTADSRRASLDLLLLHSSFHLQHSHQQRR